MSDVKDADDLNELVDFEQEEDAIAERVEETKEQTDAGKKGHYAGIHASGFRDFLLKPDIMRAISDAGFEHPSEVQHECLLPAIQGMDILCQAKSGMGKTAVFVMSILHRLQPVEGETSVLVLTHTRELAFQIAKEFNRFSKYMPDVKTAVFYGGVPVKTHVQLLQKEPCNIVVGTPGRIKDLVQRGALKLDKIEFFVLDECDRMLGEVDMRADVQKIYLKTPHEKQVMMFSATMPPETKRICQRFMVDPLEVLVDKDSKLTLHGLQQYYVHLEENEKNKKLNDLLDALEFNQVVIFVKSVSRARALNKFLQDCNFPSIAIYRGMPQPERIEKFKAFKEFKHRILVSTDLFGRGIDIERVNIVINYDFPDSADQYLHRVGRAGRFGTKGLGISFVTTEEETKVLEEVQSRFAVKITTLPDSIDVSSYMS